MANKALTPLQKQLKVFPWNHLQNFDIEHELTKYRVSIGYATKKGRSKDYNSLSVLLQVIDWSSDDGKVKNANLKFTGTLAYEGTHLGLGAQIIASGKINGFDYNIFTSRFATNNSPWAIALGPKGGRVPGNVPILNFQVFGLWSAAAKKDIYHWNLRYVDKSTSEDIPVATGSWPQ